MTRRANLPGRTLLWSAAVWLAFPALAAASDEPAIDPGQREFFEKKVRPVLAEHCFQCHSEKAKKVKGKLLLDSREGLLRGGESGRVVVPGNADKSPLIAAVRYANVELRMPPRGKLPEAAVADLTTWVQMGAPWPADHAAASSGPPRKEFDLAARRKEHWAWQALRPVVPPAVRNPSWGRSPVDAFILAGLQAKGLKPASAADRRTLLRRLSFDLVGLPPTAAEVEAFVNDPSADAYERVVDRLLASAHFGERWARHWLDLVRYAETRGHEYDYPAPNAYQYRDYVIRALNADVPYDQFVTEHLAGDLLDHPRLHPVEGFDESILGTGFWFLGEEVHSPVDVREDEADRFDNRIDVMGKAFLGLTVACSRCHDHKFDAISTKDYYALFGLLESSSYRLVRFDSVVHNRRVAQELWRLRDKSRGPILRALGEELHPGLDSLADYLVAAREAMQTGGKLEEVARARGLEEAVLRRWVAYLRAAAKDERDPLHAWGRLAVSPVSTGLSQLLSPIVEKGHKRQKEVEAALRGVQVVIDYRKPDPQNWFPDGVSFGPGPVQPGEVRFSDGPEGPVVRVIGRTAAEKDPVWDALKLAPGSENDAGALGQVPRLGRTIRTPTFTLDAGKLFYLVKGTGTAYAAVGQHGLIAGPLHARLITPIKTGDQFQWVGHDLTPYRGKPVHVEFTAAPGADFALVMVVQGMVAPPSMAAPNSLVVNLLESNASSSAEELARAYQRLLRETVERLASDRIMDSPEAADYAALTNWLRQRRELLVPNRVQDKRLAEAAAPFLREQAGLLGQRKLESRLAMAPLDGNGVDERVFIRGSPKALGEAVPRRFLEALAGPEPLPVVHGSGRLELARQMTDASLNPFLPRVMANRVWHHLFGRGIVASVDNFGVLGERPTHPELLDYLAGQFVRERWSVKKLIRSLVLSQTYQMASVAEPTADRADPQNLLLHRMPRRRLEGEAIRDAMLAVSGRLSGRMYGPSVPVYLTAFQEGRGKPPSGPLDGDGRRSLYLAVRRNFLSPFLLAFDTPIPFSTVGGRSVSNVPAQALILMNDPFVHQQAEAWARRALRQPGGERERIIGMYLSAFSRCPTEAELNACVEFLEGQRRLSSGPGAEPAAWTDLAHTLFNVKEFIISN